MRVYHGLSWASFLLCCVVVVFGAFVRLSDAGLGCPDWPTCYGKATWPTAALELEQANQAFPQRPVETHKAWREQFHRHLAATLGTLVLALAVLAARGRRGGPQLILGAAAVVTLAVVLHLLGLRGVDTALVVVAELALLLFAWRGPAGHVSRLTTLALAVVVFQAILGMWTVTWQLKPLVVTGHLLFGLLTLALLWWNLLGLLRAGAPLPPVAPWLRRLALLSLLALVGQIFLGGWTSTNYAALVCPDFPGCMPGQAWPAGDYADAFQLWRGLDQNYEFGVLDAPQRAVIQMSHRLGAVVLSGLLLALMVSLWRSPLGTGRAYALALFSALALQLLIGYSIIHWVLPLPLATAHNAGAALLLLAVVAVNHRLFGRGRQESVT